MWEEIEIFAGKMAKFGQRQPISVGPLIIFHVIMKNSRPISVILFFSEDFSERILRMEKLIESNELFQNFLVGRFALDINRTILQTGIAAHAPLQDYVTFVLRDSPS